MVGSLVRYTAMPAEVKELQGLASSWTFWRFGDISKTLARPDCSLHYLPSCEAGGDWRGLVFLSVNDQFAEILYIYVNPIFRQQGLGQLLLSEVVNLLWVEFYVQTLFLEVRISNTIAQRLYERFGMKKVELKVSYYSDGEDALIYQFRNMEQY